MAGKERAAFLVVFKDGSSDVSFTLHELQITQIQLYSSSTLRIYSRFTTLNITTPIPVAARPKAARLLGPRVQTPLRACMFPCPEKSCRMCVSNCA